MEDVLQAVQAIQQELQRQNAAIISMQQASQAQPRQSSRGKSPVRFAEGQADDEDMPEDEEDAAEDPDDSWTSVLGSNALIPVTSAAVSFCARLAPPPALDVLKGLESAVPKYQSIPVTPAPRKYSKDISLYQAQKKAEHAMHLLVHAVETKDMQHLNTTAVWVR